MAYQDMTPEQLRSLAAKKEREAKPNVINYDKMKPAPVPKLTAPAEVTLGDKTLHVQPGLEDDWDFQVMIAKFESAANSNDNVKIVEMTDSVLSYMYVEPLEEIMEILKTLHPEDKRPHVHVEDIRNLLTDGSPKVS